MQDANDHHRIRLEFEEDGVVAVGASADAITQLGALAIAGWVEGNTLTLRSQLAHESEGRMGLSAAM